MGFNDINPSTGIKWTSRVHESTPELKKRFADAIQALIEENGGKFVGTYYEILNKAGLDKSYYGDLFNDMNEIREEYGIKKERGPRRGKNVGDIYTLEPINQKDKSFNIEENALELITQIRFLLSKKDIEKFSREDAISLLNVIKLIIEN